MALFWILNKSQDSASPSSYGNLESYHIKVGGRGFPGGTVVENPPANAGDTGSIPGPGRPLMPRSN